MNITAITFGAKKARAISEKDETKILKYTQKADLHLNKALNAKSSEAITNEIMKTHAYLDKAIALNPKDTYVRFPDLNGKKFDTQLLFMRKHLAALFHEGEKPAPTDSETIQLNPKTAYAKRLIKYHENMKKALDDYQKYKRNNPFFIGF